MISFDNLLEIDEREFGLQFEGRHTLVSHAHTDHLPTAFKSNKILCSNITRKIMEFKKKKTTQEFSNKSIVLLDAGHILGSSMFYIKKELLYTGDFNTKDGYAGKASPVKCKKLIMECTYGNPNYIFPEKKEVLKELGEYLNEVQGAVITTSDISFGKPQEICAALNNMKIPFSVNSRLEEVNNLLGLKFKYLDKKSPILVGSSYDQKYIPSNFKKIHMSGWCSNKVHGIDRGFPFSSHADYPSLIEFVKKCNPEEILTHHGFDVEFAADLRKLGFNARPINQKKTYQTTLNLN